jgi:hypothetical protein
VLPLCAVQALYNFVGVVEVLQPSKDCDFVLPDEGHDMLPPGAALYKLTDPQQQPAADSGEGQAGQPKSRCGSFNSLSSLTNITSRSLSSALAELTSSFSLGGSSSGSAGPGDGASFISSLGMVAVPLADAALAPSSAAAVGASLQVSPYAEVQGDHDMSPAAAVAAATVSPAASTAVKQSPEGLTLGDAILTFMNSPHPLQTLGEMRAYGHNGSISRYHNPTSYTKALQNLNRD